MRVWGLEECLEVSPVRHSFLNWHRCPPYLAGNTCTPPGTPSAWANLELPGCLSSIASYPEEVRPEMVRKSVS